MAEQTGAMDLEALKRLRLAHYRWATIDTEGYATVLSQWATFARDTSGALFGFVSGAGWPEMAHELSDELTSALNQLPVIIAALERAERLQAVAQRLVQRGPQSAVWPEFYDLVTGRPGAWKQAVGGTAAPEGSDA